MKTFLLVLATLVAGPALAGEPLTHDDLQHQDAKNTKQQTTDRRVDRDDLHHSSAQTEICKCEPVAAQEDVRLERGRFVVTEDQGGGAKVEVIHDEEAVRKTADDDSLGEDLRDTARDIVDGAEEAIDDIEDSLD